MKKTYQSPTANKEDVKLENLMQAGSVGNAGTKNENPGEYQTGVDKNDNANIEVDAKRYNAWNTWDDED